MLEQNKSSVHESKNLSVYGECSNRMGRGRLALVGYETLD